MPSSDESHMQRAIELAQRGAGSVEPNPMVGCVLVRDDEVIGSGWHQVFGGPHAEINALAPLDQTSSAPNGIRVSPERATVYVTLEPCSHRGKTGPCTEALINAKVARVVVACEDPNPLVAGTGIAILREAGIQVDVGVLKQAAHQVLAPYLKRLNQQRPWMIAKWAMTMDGKIATATGDSKWISSQESRAIVHQIRGRVDAVMVGIGTALADDPMLNARPPGLRVPTRIVVDSLARLPVDSKLATTAKEYPTLVATGPGADSSKCQQLKGLGCSVFQSQSTNANERLLELLTHLAAAEMTNILVEGGGQLLGSLNDLGQLDEIHTFIAPKIVGGANSVSPIGGRGMNLISDSTELKIKSVRQVGGDVYVVARKQREHGANSNGSS